MHYNISAALILIAIVILAIALIAAIIAWTTLKNDNPLFVNAGNSSNIKSTLIFLIVVISVMLLVSFYALAKIRTSNIGGWLGFIVGLILVILVLIFGISAINKVNPAYPLILRGLVVSVIFIVLSFFLLMLSVFTKPRVCTGNSIKKIYQNMKLKAEDCAPQINCAPPQAINCAPPQAINCAPPQAINCAPPQAINCAPNNGYMGPNGQIANYVQNPYLPQK